MKSKLLLICVVLFLSGCVSSDEYDELAAKNEKLSDELESLQQEINQLTENQSLIEEEHKISEDGYIDDMKLTEEEQLLLDMYNNEYFEVYHGLTDARVLIEVELNEPLRSLPSTSAPYIFRSKLTYELDTSENSFPKGICEGELIYTTMDSNWNEWCLIVTDGNIGYVNSDQIVNYSNANEVSYETQEQFSDLTLGMSLDELQAMYPDKVKFIKPKLAYFRMAEIINDGDYYFDVFYNPNTRIVDFIRVNSSDFPLKSGYKVGDDTEVVFEYYDDIYEQVDLGLNFSGEHRIYDIGNGYWLEIDGREGKVTTIILTPGYNIYT